MSIGLRVILIAMSVLSLVYVVWKIRYSKMQIEYALFWIVLSILMIIMSVCPELVYWMTRSLGMMSPANLVFFFIIGVLLLKVFMMTIEISDLENKVKDLVQQIAINEKVQTDEMNEIENEIDET